MLRVDGVPVLENKTNLGFLVPWFLGFKESWFLGFRVCWFLGLKDPQNPLMFLKDIWSILPNFHSVFLIDIDLISKISRFY